MYGGRLLRQNHAKRPLSGRFAFLDGIFPCLCGSTHGSCLEAMRRAASSASTRRVARSLSLCTVIFSQLLGDECVGRMRGRHSGKIVWKRPLASAYAVSALMSVMTMLNLLAPVFPALPASRGGEASDALAEFVSRPASCALNRRPGKMPGVNKEKPASVSRGGFPRFS